MEGQQQAAEYLAQHKYAEGIALYEQMIEVEPTLMSNYWHLGLALLLQGQESEAQLTWLSAIAQGSSEQVEAYTAELIEVLAAEAERREAISDLPVAWILRQYIGQFAPENLNNLLSLIQISIELDRFSTHGKLVLLQATQLMISEQCHEVNQDLLVQVLGKLIEINPYHDFLEICLMNSQIIADSEQVANLKKELALAYNNLARVMYTQQHYNQSLNILQKIIELKPNLEQRKLAELNFNVGLTLMKLDKFEPAIRWFEEALVLDSSFNLAAIQLIQATYQAENALKGYQFTQDWFSRNIAIWQQTLTCLANTPELKALEIGSWEGRSTCWLLENILTHETARITCIDTFEGSVEHQFYDESYLKSVEERFDFNIVKTGSHEKVKKLVGRSQDVMRSLPLNYYDILYIDGSHLASDVLEDAVIGWGLIKVGGIIIFDDYDFNFADNPEQNTKIGIDAFLTVFAQKIKVIHKDFQVILEKIAV